jgi:hypothetical protein
VQAVRLEGSKARECRWRWRAEGREQGLVCGSGCCGRKLLPALCFSRRKVKVGRDYWLPGTCCLAALVSQTHSEQAACEDRRAGVGDVRSELEGRRRSALKLHCDLDGRSQSNGCACQGAAIDPGAGGLGRVWVGQTDCSTTEP